MKTKERKVGRASRHRSPSQTNHKGVTIAIVLATLQGMLAVRQEIKSVVTACGARGHFVVCCWRKGATKTPPRANHERSRKAYHVKEGATGRGDGYAFMIKGQQETGEITLNVGGVQLDGVLIDSGTV